MRFTADGYRGSIVLHALANFAQTLEGVAADGVMSTPCAAAFTAATGAIAEQAIIEIDADPGLTLGADASDDGDVAVFPLLDGGDVLGALELRVASTAQGDPGESQDSGAAPDGGAAVDLTPLPPPSVTPASSGPSYVLADVEMGVTAELGRCRMTMRELLSITPGAVIDLDRSAGAPVDVLVNGTLIARGEVVVVDEEFGIRISELIPR